MKRYSEHIKKVLFFLILGVLLIPLVQLVHPVFKIEPLSGAIEKVEDAHISKTTWFSGDYQKQTDAYSKANFGLNQPAIRLYNQLEYSLYDKLNANGALIGKKGYLYEENYIMAYKGVDFIGEDSIKKQVEKLQFISESLKSKNIHLVVMFAPGKASFYPDFFPERYDGMKSQTTNYETYIKHFNNKNINFLDFHKWFRDMKSTVHQTHKLYSKTGIHWSKYGEYVAMDSLLRYFSRLTNDSFPEIELKKIEFSRKLRDTDNDVWKGLNLLKMFADYEMSYPVTERRYPERNNKKVMTISDSYYWGMFNYGLSRDYFADGEFWYYYNEIYPQNYSTKTLVNMQDVVQKINENKIVLIMCTEANFSRIGFGFIDEVYRQLNK